MSPADLPSLRDEVPDGPTTVSNAPAVAVRVLERALGKQIRQVRRELDLSVADLANAAGISIGMMSKIENGQISPSLSTLQAISSALSVPLSSLFASFEERQDCSYVPAGQGVTIERRGTKVGHVYQLLGHVLRGDVVVEPYLYMLNGEITYRHGAQSYQLKEGDALLFDSSALHGPERLTEGETVYLSIIV